MHPDKKIVQDLLLVFARSIFTKLEALKRLPLESGPPIRRLRKSISDDIRTCAGLVYEYRLPEVSKAALKEAQRLGVDLRDWKWRHQAKHDRKRRTFHWEHVNPVSCIRAKCEEAENEEAVLEILNNRLRIAWILKREDEELTKLGCRSKRPDPEKAYREAKIELISLESE